MLLLSVGHSHRILKVKYILLTIQLLELGLDAMSALMKGPVQSSVERYHNVCGLERTINTHLGSSECKRDSIQKCSKMVYQSSATFNMAVSLWLCCTYDIFTGVLFHDNVPQFQFKC